MQGVLKRKRNPFNRVLAGIAAGDISVFPVPGDDVFMAKAGSLEEYGFLLASNPRSANLLLITGPVTKNLVRNIEVVYSQMPRPRLAVYAGDDKPEYLTIADMQVPVDEIYQSAFREKVVSLLSDPFREDASAFKPGFIREEENKEKKEKEHKHHDQKDQGKHEDEHSGHNDHEGHGSSGGHEDHEGHEGHEGQEDKGGHDQHEAHGNHGNHGGHGGGFMSMIKMTKDMPRASDGLAMERNQAGFGPFFPSFPGGLAFYLTLDGDTVVKAKPDIRLLNRDIAGSLKGKSVHLPDKLEKLSPLTPATYRVMGEQLLEKSYGNPYSFTFKQLMLVEGERIHSHLYWLSRMAIAAGNPWLHQQALGILQKVKKKKATAAEIREFVGKIKRMHYLKIKLRKTGAIPQDLLHHVSGPVSRAAGVEHDQRLEEPVYMALGFKPIVLWDNNCWGRMMVRVMEIEQSFQLIQAASNRNPGEGKMKEQETSFNLVSIDMETPRGHSSLRIWLFEDEIEQLELKPVSGINAGIANTIVKEMELSDALNTIVSLDIDPWEMAEYTSILKNKNREY